MADLRLGTDASAMADKDEVDENVIWLVGWEYSDKSGSEFVSAFDMEGDARELHQILEKHGGDGRQYYCKPVPFKMDFA